MADAASLVRDLMTQRVVSVAPEQTVSGALAAMASNKVHELPVLEKGRLKGWVTYDDLVRRAAVPNRAKVTSVMRTPARIAATDDAIDAAARMIEFHAGALPVCDKKDRVVGILSRTDLLAAALSVAEVADQPLETVMTRDLEVASQDEKLGPVEHRLRSLHVNQLLVTDEHGKLAGYVGLEHVAQARHMRSPKGQRAGRDGTGMEGPGRRKTGGVNVGSIAVEAPSIGADATLGAAIELMQARGTSFVSVVEEGMPVGVVARANVMERLAALRATPETLVQVTGLGRIVDQDVFDQIRAKCQKSLQRIESGFHVDFLSLHYKVYKAKSAGDEKFSLTAHLATERGFLVAKADAWDPLEVTDDALDILSRRTHRLKERRVSRRRRDGARRRAPADE